MFVLVINVHKGTLDVRKTFHLALQALAHVVRDSKRGVLVHDNIHLDVVFLTGVVGTTRLNLGNLRVVRDGHVHQLGDELLGRRLADQQPHLLKGVGDPREEDEQRNADGTDGVEVPDEAVADNGHDQTKDVDDNVVAVVDKEDVNRGIATQEEAVDHEGTLGADCNEICC